MLQPIVVRKNREGVFELIAGERRLRASQMVGLAQIPAVIKEITDQACLAFAIIENIQRQDLNVVELAQSLHSLATKYGMTHSDVGRLVGKSRGCFECDSSTSVVRGCQGDACKVDGKVPRVAREVT